MIKSEVISIMLQERFFSPPAAVKSSAVVHEENLEMVVEESPAQFERSVLPAAHLLALF
jgi:hypothetical protein